MADSTGSNHYKAKAENILADLHQIRNDSGVSYSDGLDMLFEALDEAGFFLDPEFEYGYKHVRDDGTELPIKEVGRTPHNWLNHMGEPYRRRKAIEAGEWELAGEDVTIELAPRPWLRPGGHPTHHPLENRSAHRETPEWSFAPDGSYEQRIERYGYRVAACGRTESHWPHSSSSLPYCSGSLVEPLRYDSKTSE